MLKVFEIRDARELDRLPWFQQRKRAVLPSGEAAQTVAQIIADVATHGDEAVVRYMRQWTDPGFEAGRIRVDPAQIKRALDGLDRALRQALQKAIEHVRTYQEHIRPRDPKRLQLGGAELGMRFTPVERVGLAVPGGRAAYPSSVIMLAVPALVAGVATQNLAVVTPPPTRTAGEPIGDVSPLVLAACGMLGIERVYRIGGAQGIAAMALGTASVPAVDLIVGPGNVYTQLAKLQLSGVVGIDGFYGPSEILTVADGSADPARVAADLIAQAEHDPGLCFLVAWERSVVEDVDRAVAEQARQRQRHQAIEKSLEQGSAAVLVPDERQAAAVADRIAAEHVNLAVADPEVWLDRLRHGGEFFLGDATPVAAGDYWAGPSHCLPTGTTARFASGVSVYTFLKRSGTVRYRGGMPQEAIDGIARLAQAEGLEGHAASVRARQPRS
jgi:histidinol dehydrogenase